MIKVASEFNLVRGATSAELVRNVMAAIRDGFEPQGGTTVYEGPGTLVFVQAVTKYIVVGSVEEYDRLQREIEAAR